eukprot:GHUV01031514.1.p4 GENE.GHUV01031514.1~~GHUV01031514.1.p4  ORF type:complete len:107 (-),score=17.56 GHUV01031514.1:1029-1349(-)
MALASVPSMVSVIAMDGRVLQQNSKWQLVYLVVDALRQVAKCICSEKGINQVLLQIVVKGFTTLFATLVQAMVIAMHRPVLQQSTDIYILACVVSLQECNPLQSQV